MAKLISKTYGDALFDAVMEQNKVEEVLSDVKELKEVLKNSPDLKDYLNNTSVPEEHKTEAVAELFEGRADDITVGFLMTVIRKGRFGEIDKTLDYFIERVKEYKKIGVAYVTSAVSLNEDEKKQIEQKLLSVTDYSEFEINYTIDPAIIGGLVIRIKDRVFDNSIKNRLDDLSGQLMRIHLS